MDIITPVKCRHCAKTFLPPAEPMDINNPTQEWFKFSAVLTKHLAAKHSKVLGAAQQAGGEFAGVLALKSFDIHDGEFQQWADYVRWKVFTITQRAKVTDERIRERVDQVIKETAAVGGVGALREGMVALLCEMRDVLEERGLYPLSGPAPAPVLSPNGTPPAAN